MTIDEKADRVAADWLATTPGITVLDFDDDDLEPVRCGTCGAYSSDADDVADYEPCLRVTGSGELVRRGDHEWLPDEPPCPECGCEPVMPHFDGCVIGNETGGTW